jgi:hypothetical protein
MSDDKPYTIKVEVPTHLDEDDTRGLIEIVIDGVASIFENISTQLRTRNSTTSACLENDPKELPRPVDQETPCDNEEVVVYQDRLLGEDEAEREEG